MQYTKMFTSRLFYPTVPMPVFKKKTVSRPSTLSRSSSEEELTKAYGTLENPRERVFSDAINPISLNSQKK